jgi:glycosyltransferase involved in cell wall biosynthesis
MKVSVVSTVKDAGPAIDAFLSSLRRQTRQPDEVVIVDGGSTDGTLDTVRRADGVLALSEPGANISRGRNIAIGAAAHDVIAVTDADCVLAPDWLERLLEPLERGADVSAGFYRPIITNLVQSCSAAVSIPDEDELRPGWMPSSRSIAFRRHAYEAAGRYPEWLEIGEDMFFNHRLLQEGARLDLAPAAAVYWPLRRTLGATWDQYVRYAEGDALAGMYPERHAVRFATYAAGLVALLTGNRMLLGLGTAGAIAYARRPIRRGRRRSPAGAPERWLTLVGVVPMMAFIDAAKMYGYLRGLVVRARGGASRDMPISGVRAGGGLGRPRA